MDNVVLGPLMHHAATVLYSALLTALSFFVGPHYRGMTGIGAWTMIIHSVCQQRQTDQVTTLTQLLADNTVVDSFIMSDYKQPDLC